MKANSNQDNAGSKTIHLWQGRAECMLLTSIVRDQKSACELTGAVVRVAGGKMHERRGEAELVTYEDGLLGALGGSCNAV